MPLPRHISRHSIQASHQLQRCIGVGRVRGDHLQIAGQVQQPNGQFERVVMVDPFGCGPHPLRCREGENNGAVALAGVVPLLSHNRFYSVAPVAWASAPAVANRHSDGANHLVGKTFREFRNG